MEDLDNVKPMKSMISPLYTSGKYFEDPHKYSEDAKFKADNFLELFLKVARQHDLKVSSYIDVGCGAGETVKMVSGGLQAAGLNLKVVKGYDVSPHVKSLEHEAIEFVHRDFCRSTEYVDLVTLFDVFEHVPDPIQFIKAVSQRCNIIGFHIPLDYSVNGAMRDMFRAQLRDPGHLLFMDSAYALNLLTLSGLMVIDYKYTFGFMTPGGHSTIPSKLIFPFRVFLSKLSPWLLSKLMGGASLLVIALTPGGFNKLQF